MAKYELLTKEHLEHFIETVEKANPDEATSMALELLEYRRAYGPLGCQWLESE